ncbi:MAG: PDZ domain-containing protein [Acidobacteriota bacterium]
MKTFSLAFVLLTAAGLALAQPAEAPEFDVEEFFALAQPAPPAPPVPPAPPMAIRMGSGSYLGIGVAEIDAERAKALKLAEERGIEVTRLEKDSPAEKAGLKEGDVVLEYNGQRVEGAEQFVRLVRETPPGRAAKLLISRGGATQTLTATVGNRKDRTWPLGPEFQRDMEKFRENMRGMRLYMPDMPSGFMSWRSSMLGVEAESLSSQLAEFFGVKEGVLVRSVIKDSAAEKAGIKAGDVITKVDGQAVKTPGEISSRIRSQRDKAAFPVTVVRSRQEMTFTVTLEQEREEGRGRTAPRPRTVVIEKKVRL